jgi:hypothetical protein
MRAMPSSSALPKVLLPECCLRQETRPGLLACRIAPVVDEFVLERSPETLGGCVIVTVSMPTHQRLHAELGRQRALFMQAIFAAAVSVLNQDGWQAAQRDVPEQGLH